MNQTSDLPNSFITAPRRGWRREWTLCVTIFLSLRVIASVFGYSMFVSKPDPNPLSSGPVNAAADSLLHKDQFSRLFINVWNRWDTPWYLKIAAFGYDPADGTIAYLPLYPWLIAALGALIGDYLLAALLISNAAMLVVLLLFYEIARTEGLTSEDASFAVLSLAVFPSAFFLLTAYTDALFLALVFGAWLAARKRFWLLAGILGGFATLTRLQGSLLMPILGLLWLREEAGFRIFEPNTWRKSALVVHPASWLATLFPGFALIGWNFYLRAAGLGTIPKILMIHWGIRTVPPWVGIWFFLGRLFTTPRVFIDYVDLAAVIFILIMLIYGLRRLDPLLSLYAWLSLALFFMRGTPCHLLDSFSRYMLGVFPAFLIMPVIPSRAARLSLWMTSFVLQSFLLMGFLDWRWIA
jgi:Dolichyl-phosphate-mannose-protein mannosyltransferase